MLASLVLGIVLMLYFFHVKGYGLDELIQTIKNIISRVE